MLSMLSSAHVGNDTTMASSRYPNFTDFGIKSQIIAQSPLPGQMSGPKLQQVSDEPLQYKTSTKLNLEMNTENSISVSVLTKNGGSLVAKASSLGSVDGFCKPLLEKVDEECYQCKLYARGQFVGTGETKITISENLTDICSIILEFQVIEQKQTQSGFNPYSNQAQIPPPPQASVSFQNQSINNQTGVYTTQMMNQHMNQTQHSNTPATFYPGISYAPNQSIYDAPNNYSSQINQPTPAPQQFQSNVTPLQNYTQVPLSVPVNAPSVDIQNYDQQQQQQHFQNSMHNSRSQNILKQSIAQTHSHDNQIHVPNTRESINNIVTSNKVIRVLPSDAIFPPADAMHPSVRPIRVRNVFNEPLQISCSIIGRSYDPDIEKNVNCCKTNQPFTIVQNQKFTLQNCVDPDQEIISQDVIIQFQPRNAQITEQQQWLFAAKLVIQVVGQTVKKSFQVPLLGAFGQPDIVTKIISNNQLMIENIGQCPSFLRLKPVISGQNKKHARNAIQAPLALDFDSLVLQPGQCQTVRLTQIQTEYNMSTDETVCIEIRYGHEALRLLALASEGKGAWKGIYDVLRIKDDVLRVMGNCLECQIVEIQ
ncbi:hypothetical protein SS50377_28224 [Spironucleus salmonicida]|uniref:Uncharacterized protein n=1 Tax=Spironucleus salmonicida TaxID=348837 RepID=V6LXG0_9EUKA|nr:hypothetical protein SS50377_28224 [Spironucleus salmonicida]|eukprot:EST48406.1 hypothetical protein SS50377_11354 [Spironucleus salmonicida]